MADAELNIVLKLIDEATAGIKKSTETISRQFSEAGSSLEKFGKDLERTSRNLSQVGTTIAFVGAGITGPFLLAIRNASQDSILLSQRMKVIDSISRELSNTIAQALVPVINQFINGLAAVKNWFLSLNPEFRNMIIQATFMSGVFISLIGILTIFTAKILGLIGNVSQLVGSFMGFASVHPVVVGIIAIVGALFFLMMQFPNAAQNVANAFQSVFLSLEQGFFQAKSGMENFISSSMEKLSMLYQAMASLPGPLQEFYRQAAVNSLEASVNLQRFANEDMVNAEIAAIKLRDILMNKDGTWAQGLDKIREKVLSLINAIPGIGTATKSTVENARISFKQLSDGLQFSLSQLSASLSQAAAANKSFAEAAKVAAIGLAIISTAAGIARALKDWPWPFSMIVGGIVAAAGAIQIATIASQKMHSGGMVGNNFAPDEVPIIAQTGEGILSRRGMSALGGESNLNALNRGDAVPGGEGVSITINYPKFNTREDMDELAKLLGIQLQKELRYARGL